MSSAVLELLHVQRVYTQGSEALPVLKDVSLTVNRGEIVALIGPSGCGKSTLLQVAGLLDAPTAGEVKINGESMAHARDAIRTHARKRHIGFVYQFHHLLPEFSALENVALPGMIAGLSTHAAMKRAERLLADLGLAARLSHRPARLSGGEQQRVAIARALMNEPTLLLADEPTGNLDPHTAEEVFDIFLKTVREHKLAALIVTHNPDLARRMDRVVQLANGSIAKS